MAERTEGTIDIAATPEQVMAVITDFEAYPEWAGVKAADVLTVYEDDDLPAEVAMSVSQMGVDAAYTLAYEYGEDPTSVSWTTVEASGAVRDVQGEYVLEPEGDGTTVTYRLALELTISLPGFLRRQAERQVVSTALGGLKRRVEGGRS